MTRPDDPLTRAEIDEARSSAQAAASRADGSPHDCPYRLLGAPEEEKPRRLALARLWLTAFYDTRAWRREQGL